MHTDAFVAPAMVEYMQLEQLAQLNLQLEQVEVFELECVPGLQVSHEGVATMLNVPAAQPEQALESITAEKVPAPQVRQTPLHRRCCCLCARCGSQAGTAGGRTPLRMHQNTARTASGRCRRVRPGSR